MFARWRNLAAAAGALCFPLSLAHAASQTTDFHRNHIAPCTRFQETTTDESSFFRSERDAWYQRYYGTTLDDAAPIDDPTTLTLPSRTPSDQPSVIISDIEPLDDYTDDSNTTDEKGTSNQCDIINCPCHEIFDSNDDEEQGELETDARTTTPILDIESEFFDVYAPYVHREEMESEPSKSVPAAELTGSIEPIFDDSEAIWFNEWFRDDAAATEGSSIAPNKTDSIWDTDDSASDGCDEGALESDRAIERGTKYHMFYPGCDWSPYVPDFEGGERSASQLPEDVRSA